MTTEGLLFEHGGNLYKAMKERNLTAEHVLDFSANINPLGLAASVRTAISEALPFIIHYPDPGAEELKAAISAYYQVPHTAITAGNGAVELMYVLCHIVHAKRVLVPAPAFSEYERAAVASGATVAYHTLVEQDGYALEPAALIPHCGSADIIFIGNPNNPTGTLVPREQLRPLLDAALQTDTLVVVDESFLDFLTDDQTYTCRPLLPHYANLVIIHSLTKFYAIPGLRLGFSLTSPELAAKLHGAKDPWNVNSLAQRAGVAALADGAYQAASRAFISREKEQLYHGLSAINGVQPYPPAVNFILLNIEGTGVTAAEARERMLKHHGIMVRDCSNYHGLSPYYLRVAVKQTQQNEALLAAFRAEFL